MKTLSNKDLKLKPCPFCGGKARLIKIDAFWWISPDQYYVECETCQTYPGNKLRDTLEEAVSVWQNRQITK